MPWAVLASIIVPNFQKLKLSSIIISAGAEIWNLPLKLVVLGAAMLISYYYSYRRKYKRVSIEELLLREDASPVKGIPAIIEGKIIGKGIPGLFWSEDIVIDDGTGIITVDYRQPLRFLEFLFGLLIVDNMTEKNAKVIGWYKRSNRPYFACKHIIVENKKYVSYVYILTKIIGFAAILAGMALYALSLVG